MVVKNQTSSQGQQQTFSGHTAHRNSSPCVSLVLCVLSSSPAPPVCCCQVEYFSSATPISDSISRAKPTRVRCKIIWINPPLVTALQSQLALINGTWMGNWYEHANEHVVKCGAWDRFRFRVLINHRHQCHQNPRVCRRQKGNPRD